MAVEGAFGIETVAVLRKLIASLLLPASYKLNPQNGRWANDRKFKQVARRLSDVHVLYHSDQLVILTRAKI